MTRQVVLVGTKVTEDKNTISMVLRGHDEETVINKNDIMEIRQSESEQDDIVVRLSLDVAKEKGIV